MKTHALSLGEVQLNNNVFLAPMAGYTDYTFRHMALKQGYSLSFTELVSAKGIVYKNSGNTELLYCGEDLNNTAVQIFGCDPYFMRSALESDELKGFKIADINMGCPVPKIYKNGEGSALLNNVNLASKLVSECVKSGKIITIKIRTGLKTGDDVATDFAKMAEQAGAKLITIHGRVRENYYSGEIDYNAIYNAKRAVSIPVIANGGIFTVEDADRVLDRTGADGIMLARGAISEPFLVNKLLGVEQKITLKQFILKHLRLREKFLTPKKACIDFRKFVPYYFKGMDGVKELKTKIYQAQSISEMIGLIEKYM